MDNHIWLLRTVIVVLLIFICFVYYRSWKSFYNKDDNCFRENLHQYRKTLYFIFVLIVGTLSLLKIIDKNEWQYLLMSAVIVIFTDVFVFSTPTIKKIWNTEFGVHDEIKEYIQKNNLIAKNQQDKLNFFSELVQLAGVLKEDILNKGLNEFDSLDVFLNYYPERFGLRMHLYEISMDIQKNEEIYPGFIELLTQIKDTHTLNFETMSNNLIRVKNDKRANEQLAVGKLLDGSILALNREEYGMGMAHLCPIFITGRSLYLIFLEEVGQKVYEMDPLLITDLAYVFFFLEGNSAVK